MDRQKFIDDYRMFRSAMVKGNEFASFRYTFRDKPRSDAVANQRTSSKMP